jgi:hypothetical protein
MIAILINNMGWMDLHQKNISRIIFVFLLPLLPLLLLLPVGPPPLATTGAAVGAMYPGEYEGCFPGTKGIPGGNG